ncbi:hypothetical protein E5676_scaffold16G00100 [Cucumis melo var. makuwa]|uniref:Uncharacterized protein n=1 Tax=Cucumis melo var. makuwa TaxID=1194695 RepID=A0A5A7UMZ2_CUCMM|nr:hypothetical protein E6C27_scaffold181G00110 [Cucumis melo var. makuwa]TYK09900.1 hypothetical protein E5676_scaffold16G00100 [Cucumis melo var. makuwa]
MDVTQPGIDDEENEGEVLHLKEREIRETSTLPDPLHHSNVDCEEVATPFPSSHVNAIIHPQSKRPQNRPLDSLLVMLDQHFVNYPLKRFNLSWKK